MPFLQTRLSDSSSGPTLAAWRWDAYRLLFGVSAGSGGPSVEGMTARRLRPVYLAGAGKGGVLCPRPIRCPTIGSGGWIPGTLRLAMGPRNRPTAFPPRFGVPWNAIAHPVWVAPVLGAAPCAGHG